MTLMEEMVKRAVFRFKEGYNCCESILMSYTEVKKIRSGIVPKIATGFGGGIGRRGSVCGALTGATMAISLKYGRDRLDQKGYDLCVAKSSECYERFKKEFGDVHCLNLIRCDLSTSKGRTLFKEMKLKESNCIKYVEGAAKIVLDITK